MIQYVLHMLRMVAKVNILHVFKRAQCTSLGRGLLAIVAGLLLLSPMPVRAIPQPGHYFYGSARHLGQPVQQGCQITVKVSGTALEYGTVTDDQGRYGYSLPYLYVPADDPGTPAREGARPGEPLEFRVCGRRAWLHDVAAGEWRSTYPFESGGTTHLELDTLAPQSVFVPVILGGKG